MFNRVVNQPKIGMRTNENKYFSAIITDQFLVATYTDKSRVDYVYFCKRPPLGEAIKKLEKLSVWEPKVCIYKLHRMFYTQLL